MGKWISVRDQLPEPFRIVKVLRRVAGGNILEQTGYFDLRKLQWRVNDRLTRRVTHWKLIEEEDHV